MIKPKTRLTRDKKKLLFGTMFIIFWAVALNVLIALLANKFGLPYWARIAMSFVVGLPIGFATFHFFQGIIETVPIPCTMCGRPSYHTVLEVQRGEMHLCCKHYILDGHAPANWHPECMGAWEKKKNGDVLYE